jgi:hypothetical protein
MPAATTSQAAPSQEAGRAQPQTTVEPAGGPFIRHSQPGRRAQYNISGSAYGTLITQPLVAVPGYVSRLRLSVSATGGTGTVAVYAADAPFNVASLVTLKDAFGTPLIVGPGWEMLYAVPKYSSQFGLLTMADIKNLPSYGAPATSGNYSFSTALPFEFAKAYGLVSMANASLLPTLQTQYAPSTTVYTTPPTTIPTLTTQLDADFYWLPEGVTVDPPGLGTTCQWVMQNCYPTIPSASPMIVSLPRLGGFLHTLIFVVRDSTGARIDAYGTRMRVYVDGVPLIDSTFNEIVDDMSIVYGGITRDTGLVAISRRTSLSQLNLGLLDTGEVFLSTNPGTLIQVECSPWGTIANAPATLEALVGQVVPAGSLIQGLPEL